MFVIVFWKIGLSLIIVPYLIVFSLLISIFIYDLLHKIIPDGLVWTFNALAFLILANNIGLSGFINFDNISAILSGPVLFSFFAFFWLVSSGKWMGFGDAKLALGIGWLLGLSGGAFAILLAFWIGALWSIFAILIKKLKISKNRLTLKSEIPFAPFILFGFLIIFITGWSLVDLFCIIG
jgi:prepilin signal peptidase PulO-like enzyme (type II secretory pathway)